MEVLYVIINTIVVAAVGGMLKIYDSRNEKRGRARDEFNAIILQGFEAIGKVAVLTAYKVKGQEVNGKLDKAISGYEEFEKEAEKFKNRATQRAVRY